jgi:hypothetical protein
MACVVEQDGDQWTVDVAHLAYPRRKANGKPKAARTVSDATLAQRQRLCRDCCIHLRQTKHGQPYCALHTKRDGKPCQRWGVGKYANALLTITPWCEPWKEPQYEDS